MRRLLLAAAGLTVALAVGWFVLVQIGFVQLPLRRPPQPTDREVVVARDAAHLDLEDVARATMPSNAAWSARGDDCVAGQHTWKIDDPYDLRCAAVVLTITAHRSVTSWREDAAALHRALVGAGWASTDLDLERVITEYWDNPAMRGPGGLDRSRDGQYGPSDLPYATYGRGSRQVAIHFLEPGLKHSQTRHPASADRQAEIVEESQQIPNGSFATLFEFSTVYFDE